MTEPATAVCPECGGPRIPDHPMHLVFDHHNDCGLRAAEDGRTVADRDTAIGGPFTRPMTATERTLLQACGITLDVGAETAVTGLAGSLVRRDWTDAAGSPVLLDPDDTEGDTTT